MLWLLLVISFSFLLILYLYAHKNTYHPQLKEVELKLNKAPQKKKPFNILHLSDIHVERISITPEQLYSKLQGKNIDIIALTGDYLDQGENIDKFIEYLNILHQLKSKYGIYVVFGNHDYLLKDQIKVLKQRIEETGAVVLVNENRTIEIEDQYLNIIGIDDYSKKRSDIPKSFAGIKPGINLVLTHNPNIVLKMENYHFDYLLSGHFHGGQIHWPIPFHLYLWKMGKLAKRNIIKGLHFHQEKPFYISEGLGQTGINIRLRSRPEITMHILN